MEKKQNLVENVQLFVCIDCFFFISVLFVIKSIVIVFIWKYYNCFFFSYFKSTKFLRIGNLFVLSLLLLKYFYSIKIFFITVFNIIL